MTVWADKKALFEEMQDKLDAIVSRDRSQILTVWGYLGAGKSHAIQYFLNAFEHDKKVKYIYSQFPRAARDFLDVYKGAFASRMNFVDFAQRAADVHNKLALKYGERDALQIIAKRISADWDDFTSLVSALGRMYTIRGKDFFMDYNFTMAKQWLLGSKIPRANLRALSITDNITTDDAATKAVGSVVRLFTFVEPGVIDGNSAMIWALDDCHYMRSIPDKQRIRMQFGIKDSFDLCPRGLILILSIMSRVASEVDQLFIDDLLSRMSRPEIRVPPLSVEGASEFLIDLINNPSFGKTHSDNKFFPYTRETIHYVIEKMVKDGEDLTPRNLMKRFDALTNFGIESKIQFPKAIDVVMAKEFFETWQRTQDEE